eukprot:6188129-Pleurochrysis_carterae.AAC.3
MSAETFPSAPNRMMPSKNRLPTAQSSSSASARASSGSAWYVTSASDAAQWARTLRITRVLESGSSAAKASSSSKTGGQLGRKKTLRRSSNLERWPPERLAQ